VLERAAARPAPDGHRGLEAEECDGAVGLLAGLGLVEREPGEAGPKVHPLLAEFGRKLDTETGKGREQRDRGRWRRWRRRWRG